MNPDPTRYRPFWVPHLDNLYTGTVYTHERVVTSFSFHSYTTYSRVGTRSICVRDY